MSALRWEAIAAEFSDDDLEEHKQDSNGKNSHVTEDDFMYASTVQDLLEQRIHVPVTEEVQRVIDEISEKEQAEFDRKMRQVTALHNERKRQQMRKQREKERVQRHLLTNSSNTVCQVLRFLPLRDLVACAKVSTLWRDETLATMRIRGTRTNGDNALLRQLLSTNVLVQGEAPHKRPLGMFGSLPVSMDIDEFARTNFCKRSDALGDSFALQNVVCFKMNTCLRDSLSHVEALAMADDGVALFQWQRNRSPVLLRRWQFSCLFSHSRFTASQLLVDWTRRVCVLLQMFNQNEIKAAALWLDDVRSTRRFSLEFTNGPVNMESIRLEQNTGSACSRFFRLTLYHLETRSVWRLFRTPSANIDSRYVNKRVSLKADRIREIGAVSNTQQTWSYTEQYAVTVSKIKRDLSIQIVDAETRDVFSHVIDLSHRRWGSRVPSRVHVESTRVWPLARHVSVTLQHRSLRHTLLVPFEGESVWLEDIVGLPGVDVEYPYRSAKLLAMPSPKTIVVSTLSFFQLHKLETGEALGAMTSTMGYTVLDMSMRPADVFHESPASILGQDLQGEEMTAIACDGNTLIMRDACSRLISDHDSADHGLRRPNGVECVVLPVSPHSAAVWQELSQQTTDSSRFAVGARVAGELFDLCNHYVAVANGEKSALSHLSVQLRVLLMRSLQIPDSAVTIYDTTQFHVPRAEINMKTERERELFVATVVAAVHAMAHLSRGCNTLIRDQLAVPTDARPAVRYSNVVRYSCLPLYIVN
ncbi:MAG: hypothetical protein MHM6MM_004292 [Cercozoa sp. M6MM]